MFNFKTVVLPKGLKIYFKNEGPREDELLYFSFPHKSKQCKSEQRFLWRKIAIVFKSMYKKFYRFMQ